MTEPVEHICNRCGYKATSFTNLRIHLQKVKICLPKVADVAREIQYNLMESQRTRKVYSETEKQHVCVCTKAFAVYPSLCAHRNKCDVYKQSVDSFKEKTKKKVDQDILRGEIKRITDTIKQLQITADYLSEMLDEQK